MCLVFNQTRISHMRSRSVTVVKSNNQVVHFDLPEEDVEPYIRHMKDMDSPSLVIIDDIVVRTGLFQSAQIQPLLKKLKVGCNATKNS